MLALAALALAALPWWAGDAYQLHLATLIGAYWVLIAGLNLVVGFTGPLSVGHVGLLAIGAYAFAILAGTHGVDPMLSLLVAAALGGLIGFLLGLPSLRLPGFYFALVTLAFALIVTELVLAFGDLTGGGMGLAVPGFGPPFATPDGFYWLVLAIAAFVTWLTWNVTRLMWGRALLAVRDSEVTAASVGVSLFRKKLTVFTFSGVTAGAGGALFASLQSYITPDTFIFEIGLFFFVCIIIGGRGSILGPFLGHGGADGAAGARGALGQARQLLLRARPSAGRSPGARRDRPPPRAGAAAPAPAADRASGGGTSAGAAAGGPGRSPALSTSLVAEAVSKRFGGVSALEEVSLELLPGEIHGLIGPNGSGKTTLLNLFSGYYRADAGAVRLGSEDLTQARVQRRADLGIARTFQKPRLINSLSVLDNAMLGGWPETRSGFFASAFALPQARREDRIVRELAVEMLHGVGLGHALARSASLLEHAEQRFLEIARGLVMRPRFILLDEPAGGLTGTGDRAAAAGAGCPARGRASACSWSSTIPTSSSAAPTASPPSISAGCSGTAGPRRCAATPR